MIPVFNQQHYCLFQQNTLRKGRQQSATPGPQFRLAFFKLLFLLHITISDTDVNGCNYWEFLFLFQDMCLSVASCQYQSSAEDLLLPLMLWGNQHSP